MNRRDLIRGMGSVGIASLLQTRALGQEIQAVARGVVLGEDRPLRGVRVSDGYRVVATDRDGRFELPLSAASGPFVFVTLPGGWWTDRFFVPLAEATRGPMRFRLDRRPARDYFGLYVTDIHLGEGRREESYRRFAATVDEINALDPQPAFIWFGGDIALQGGKGEVYVEAVSLLKAPLRHMTGNHELHVRRADPLDEFHARFGPTYYSFDVGGVHYVALDGCAAVPEERGYRNVQGRFSPRELHWLEEDLKHVPEETPVVAAVHIPLVTTYAERRGVQAAEVPWWVVTNAEEVIDRLARRDTKLVLQGHFHENERLVQRGIEFVESISVCGRWWKTEGREDGVGGEPRGYRRVEVRDGRVRHRYVGSAESRVDACGEIVGRPESLPRRPDLELLVNIFDGAAGGTVTAQVDDRRPERLEAVVPVGKHEGARITHHWRWSLDAARLSPGRHLLAVRYREPGRPDETFTHPVEVTAG